MAPPLLTAVDKGVATVDEGDERAELEDKHSTERPDKTRTLKAKSNFSIMSGLLFRSSVKYALWP